MLSHLRVDHPELHEDALRKLQKPRARSQPENLQSRLLDETVSVPDDSLESLSNSSTVADTDTSKVKHDFIFCLVN